jgi:glycosyltransferase involved in cell wall biosynthesis
MAYHIRILAGQLNRNAGSHVYHIELTRRLAARGHRMSVVCFGSGAAVNDVADVMEIDPLEVQDRPLVWRFASLVRAWSCSRQLRHKSLSRPDIVIGGEHLLLRPHAAMFAKTPMIYHPHSFTVDQEIEGYGLPRGMKYVTRSVYRRAQRWALNHADRTMRFTKTACDALQQAYGVSVHPRFVINPMGIELPDETPCGASRDGHTTLLCLGTLIPRKNVALAIRALAGLRQYRWRLDIVGDGPLREELEQQVEGTGLTERVVFHGFQRDPKLYIQRADLLLLPSKSENSPVAMLEAMSHGVPCLAMRADGKEYFNANEDLIEDGRTGLLASGEEHFGQLLERVLREPSQLRPLGHAAREQVAMHHTWDRHLDRYEELFGELCRR